MSTGREIEGRSGPVEIAVIDTRRAYRLRPVSEAGVEAVMRSFEELGYLLHPIHLRLRRGVGGHGPERLELIAGGHRLEAMSRLGWERIEARVWECSDDWARLLEVDDNLAGAELSPLDTAVFLVERKRLYERMNPNARRGSAGGRKKNGVLTDTESVSTFAAATAAKFGLAERSIFRILAAGAHLTAEEITLLRGAPRPVTLADLKQIGRLADAAERGAAVARLSAGASTSIAKALRVVRGQDARAERDPVERHYEALKAAYSRAPKSAQMRFRRWLKDGSA